MGVFLNSIIPYESYKEMVMDTYFVDKSMLLAELIPAIGRKNKYFCITRPRRFGKTVMAEMTGAFFGKAADGSKLFESLEISKYNNYKEHLNKYNVIFIDFSKGSESTSTYKEYITRITSSIKNELLQEFPGLGLDIIKPLWDILTDIFQKTGQKFIFIMDEWDAVFHMSFFTCKEHEEYLLFLRNLLKDQIYVNLAYMTGILPIAKYSSGSELNIFSEYNMVTKEKFSGYFGFSDNEVDKLFGVYQSITEHPKITREELRFWYDGYYTAAGERLYNPRSVTCSLSDNQLGSYWTSSGPYDEIFYYIKDNIAQVRDDFVLMVSGEQIESVMHEYAATAKEFDNKNQIYSAMVVYGLLTYHNSKVFIPNKELMDKYNELLLSEENFGYVNRLAKESAKMLEATLSGDTKTMEKILDYVHNTESPVFSYNSEIELSAIVNLVYLSARDKYRIEREDKSGKGFVGFIFYPAYKGYDGIILELKTGSTPDKAIKQIKDKNYILRFKGKLGEKPKYTGRILAVGISYDKKTKEHFCKIEVLKQ